jgi:1-acyl-sn-glycerol-3-phosphate acyltransferase
MLYKIVGSLIAKIFSYKARFEGIENLPKTQKILVASNQINFCDGIVIGAGLWRKFKGRKKIYFIAEKKVRIAFLFFGSWLGLLPNNLKGIRKAIEYLKKGHPVIIFPEGKKNNNKETLLKGRLGAARMAISSGVKVVAVGYHVEPASGFIREVISFFKEKRVCFGVPINFQKITRKKVKLEKATHRIMSEISKLSGKEIFKK